MHFDDLFAYDLHGLCHLRAYESSEGLVALATQLTDGPGSVINGAEALAEAIERAFKVTGFRLFVSFGDTNPPTWSEVTISANGAADFRNEIPHAEVARAIDVPAEPPMARTALQVGGPGHPLLALLPDPDDDDRSVLRDMQVVAVADLPWAHNPSRCGHLSRFSRIDALYSTTLDEEQAAGAHFFLSLTPEDQGGCPYHRHDWQAIAAASVTLLDRLGPNSDYDDVEVLAADLIEDARDRSELVYLFADPIVWAPGSPSITNGQHRTCAMKAAGAPLCAVVTDSRLWADPVPSDPTRQARAVLARYWATRLGAEPTL